MRPPALAALALALAGVLAPAGAGAQGSPPETGFFTTSRDRADREGFTFGASIGPGTLQISCAGCGALEPLDQALSLSAHAGAMLTPRLALIVEHWEVIWHGRDNYWFGDSADHVVREGLSTAGAQLWLARRIWLRGGLGVSRHRTDVSYQRVPGGANPEFAGAAGGAPTPPVHGGKAPALAAAAGVELVHTTAFAIDIALRFGAAGGGDRGMTTTSGALTIGATWY